MWHINTALNIKLIKKQTIIKNKAMEYALYRYEFEVIEKKDSSVNQSYDTDWRLCSSNWVQPFFFTSPIQVNDMSFSNSFLMVLFTLGHFFRLTHYRTFTCGSRTG